MKKQDLKTFIKSKGVYITLILGALIIVVALSINRSLSDAEQKKNGLVDLNESPNIVSNDDSKGDPGSYGGLNDQFSQLDNDLLLEYDSYADGIQTPVTSEDDKANNDSQTAEIDNSSVDTEIVQPADTSKVVDAPKEAPKEQGNEIKEELTNDNEASDNSGGEEEFNEASAISTADLSFSPENGLKWPVKGNVILKYSADHAIYHETLLQFKTNPAILISCTEGTEVKAAAQGIVTDITETPQTGLTVTIAIGDDYSIVYGQLAGISCDIGDVLEAGEVFAMINKVSKYYSVEGEHLYFQVFNGAETVNPMLFLKDE